MQRRLALLTGGYFVVIAIVLIAVLPFAVDVLHIGSTIQNHFAPAQTEARRLLSAALDQETGHRGYLLTGDASYLEPYDSGRRLIATTETRLQQLSLSNDERALLNGTITALDSWINDYAEPTIAQVRAGHIDAARTDEVTTQGRILFDRFRNNESSFVDLVEGRLRTQRDDLHRYSILAIVALLVASATAAVSAFFFRRWARTTTRKDEQRTRERIAFGDVHRLGSNLASLVSTEEIATVSARDAAVLLGASDAHVWLVGERGRLRLAGSTDDYAQAGNAPSVLALDDHNPPADAVRENRMIYFAGHLEYARDYPGWAWSLDVQDAGSVAFIPTRADGRPVGLLEVFFRDGGPLEDARRTILDLTATQIGTSLARARTREIEHDAAARLQTSLLGPAVLVDGVGHGTRYLPAQSILQIGGDWYNTQQVSDGRVLVAVGDVVGRGLEAATVMGQLRSAVSACAPLCETPADLITCLDQFAREIPGAASTTAAFGYVDVVNERLDYLCAGHPPPLLVSPTGEVQLLENATTWPLGIGRARPEQLGASVPFPPGSLVLMYSDGLVERRREPLDAGIGRLIASVRQHWCRPIDALCDAVVADLTSDSRRDDDVAILALRTPVASRDLFLTTLAASAEAIGRVRERLRAWLDQLGLTPEDQLAVLVAVGEASTNAVEHAYGDGSKNLFRVEASRVGDEIVCCVTDNGAWKDNATRIARGNGLAIMRELMHEVVVDRLPIGTSITMTFRPGASDASAVLR